MLQSASSTNRDANSNFRSHTQEGLESLFMGFGGNLHLPPTGRHHPLQGHRGILWTGCGWKSAHTDCFRWRNCLCDRHPPFKAKPEEIDLSGTLRGHRIPDHEPGGQP